MNKRTRKKLEMGKRALDFCRAHPYSSPGYIAAVARLEALLARAEELERLEKQMMLRRTVKGSGSDREVIPLESRVTDDPPDPAA